LAGDFEFALINLIAGEYNRRLGIVDDGVVLASGIQIETDYYGHSRFRWD
jgi:hypothetical protein